MSPRLKWSLLAPVGEVKPRRDPIRWVARLLCVLLALVGIVPFGASLLLKSGEVRGYVARRAQAVLAQYNISAIFGASVTLWPLSVELTSVHVDSSDRGDPILTAKTLRAKPRVLPLLSFKFQLEEVEVDSPTLRIVVRDGALANLDTSAFPQKSSSDAPSPTIPLDSLSITDARVAFDIDGVTGELSGIDIDVAKDDRGKTPGLEAAVRVNRGGVRRVWTRPDAQGTPQVFVDEDVLCALEARARIVLPSSVMLRRLRVLAVSDTDPADTTAPSCVGAEANDARVELELSQFAAEWPKGNVPDLNGHARVRVPVPIANRFLPLIHPEGVITAEAHVVFRDGMSLPEVSVGKVFAERIRLDKFRFARELSADVRIVDNVIRSDKAVVLVGDGTVTVTQLMVSPFSSGDQISATVDITELDFTSLMRDLGVHPHSHVQWQVRHLRGEHFHGRFSPLMLDMDFTGHTENFGVYDKPVEDPSKRAFIAFSPVELWSHLAVRPHGVEFQRTRARVGTASEVSGASVLIGYKDELRVDAEHVHAKLSDISPIAGIEFGGTLDGSYHMSGTNRRPDISVTLRSIEDFSMGNLKFGTIQGGTARVDVLAGPKIEVKELSALRGTSPYEVPDLNITFGRGVFVRGTVTTSALRLSDFLTVFGMERDPRYQTLGGTFRTAEPVLFTFSSGGPEDVCHSGAITAGARLFAEDVSLWGERFPSGEAEFSLSWTDRKVGLAGADLKIPSLRLRKGRDGALMGSLELRQGGHLAGTVGASRVPVSSLTTGKALFSKIEGELSGVATILGTLDDFAPSGPGLVVRSRVEVGPIRVNRATRFGPSTLDVEMTHVSRPVSMAQSLGRSGCGRPVPPAYDPKADDADLSERGAFMVSGSLMGDAVRLRDVRLGRSQESRLTGAVDFHSVDLAQLYAASSGPTSTSTPQNETAAQSRLSGSLLLDDVPLGAPKRARARLSITEAYVASGGQRMDLLPPKGPIVLAEDRVALPSPFVIQVSSQGARAGEFRLSGGASNVADAPELSLDGELRPVALSTLTPFVPKIDQAEGTLSGALRVRGPPDAPILSGAIGVEASAVSIRGLPGVLSDAKVTLDVLPGELRLRGDAALGGGRVDVYGFAPLRGLSVRNVGGTVRARKVRIRPAPGVDTAFDADVRVAFDNEYRAGSKLVQIGGDIRILSLDYTRPVQLISDLTQLGGRARRTVVDSYDPSLDVAQLDLRITAAEPLRVRTDLIDAALSIDSQALVLTGTNQRYGLRGDLRTLTGGRFRLFANDFEIRQASVRFDDPTKLVANIDVHATTEYRRYADATGAVTSATATQGGTTGSGTTRGGATWRIGARVSGELDALKVELTSDPPLGQDDIALLLSVGMTRAELEQYGVGAAGANLALNVLGSSTGAERVVRQAFPLIDDFRFGTAYSTRTGRNEPQVTVYKRIVAGLRAMLAAGISESRQFRTELEWTLSRYLSLQGSYDNIYDATSSNIGNIGVDLRYRLELE